MGVAFFETMKRRPLLQSVMALLGVPFVPKPVTAFEVNKDPKFDQFSWTPNIEDAKLTELVFAALREDHKHGVEMWHGPVGTYSKKGEDGARTFYMVSRKMGTRSIGESLDDVLRSRMALMLAWEISLEAKDRKVYLWTMLTWTDFESWLHGKCQHQSHRARIPRSAL